MKKILRLTIPFFVLLCILLYWSRSHSTARAHFTDSSTDGLVPSSIREDFDQSSNPEREASSSRREHRERQAETIKEISQAEEFREEDLMHEHVIHTIVPHGSSVIVAGARDDQGKRIFTVLTPEAGHPESPKGQIKLSSSTYGLDDHQIDQAGMQTLLGDETRLHNKGEIWSAADMKNTREKWPADAALSMPTLMLEDGAEGSIEIGSLGESPQVYRTKVQVHETAAGFELKTTLQTYRRK